MSFGDFVLQHSLVRKELTVAVFCESILILQRGSRDSISLLPYGRSNFPSEERQLCSNSPFHEPRDVRGDRNPTPALEWALYIRRRGLESSRVAISVEARSSDQGVTMQQETHEFW